MLKALACICATSIIGGAIVAPAVDAKPAKRGKRGPRGPAGIPGPQGPPGPAGVTEVRFAVGPDTPIGPGQVVTATADCPAGTLAVGGGFDASDPQIRVVYSATGITSWRVIAINEGPRGATVQATATCFGGPGLHVVA